MFIVAICIRKDKFGNEFFLGRPRPHVTMTATYEYTTRQYDEEARVHDWTLERERPNRQHFTYAVIYWLPAFEYTRITAIRLECK